MLSSKKAPCYLLYFESGHALDPIGDSFNEASPGGVFEFSSSPLIRHRPQTTYTTRVFYQFPSRCGCDHFQIE
jgi:hypothetical protein